MRAAAHRWCRSERSKKATRGPVSTIAAVIAAKAREMLGIGGEVGNARIEHAPCALHQPGKRRGRTSARGFENEPQPLLDQILELAPAQRRLGLGTAVQVVGHLDRRLHDKTINPYLWAVNLEFGNKIPPSIAARILAAA